MALKQILKDKVGDVRRRKELRPLESFRRWLEPAQYSLEEALRGPRTGFILECKKAAPSGGVLRREYEPVELVEAYEPFADAISILTDEPHFQGQLDDLRAVRDTVRVPLLCKDFIIEPYQVYEARFYGADAVLLMLSVLDDDAWSACLHAAAELHMDVLTEVHDKAELERCKRLGARIIGINNRDLLTLKVDTGVTELLAPDVEGGRLIVSESGIQSHAQVRELRPLVDAFLVGTTLMKAPRLDMAVRELLFGRVKVCGLRRLEDAQAAYQNGATWGGLIFAASKRQVTLEEAVRLHREVPMRWAGVFVDDSLADITFVTEHLHLDAVQLHGDETPAFIQSLRGHLHQGCEIWKAWRVKDTIPRVAETGADRLLLDTWHPEQSGGTGEVFDWSLAASHPDRDQLVLAGGLNPDNAEQADAIGAWALDVNSGVEDAPGEKSPEKLHQFFDRLRGVR